MIFILNQQQAQKKAFSKCYKVVISSQLKEMDNLSVIIRELVPSKNVFSAYLNGELSEKKYKKAYIETIKQNDDLMATVVSIVMAYKDRKKLCLVCSDEEMNFLYLSFLCSFIKKRYGIEIVTYKTFKNDIGDIKDAGFTLSKEGIEVLNKDFKSYRDIILGEDVEEYFYKKEMKKSKKNKEKKKAKKVKNIKSSDIEDIINNNRTSDRKNSKGETLTKFAVRRL